MLKVHSVCENNKENNVIDVVIIVDAYCPIRICCLCVLLSLSHFMKRSFTLAGLEKFKKRCLKELKSAYLKTNPNTTDDHFKALNRLEYFVSQTNKQKKHVQPEITEYFTSCNEKV